jgi:alkanesulfonate monooxygenase SsuD/methylene tetrahydromethanopterin reductase-like flavin-dependent oxidoreductase (luciferase family)
VGLIAQEETLEADMTIPRRAIGLTPMETRRELIVRTAILADELGYEMFVLPEGWGLDSTLVLTEIAMKTKRIRVMAGILSIWGRTPGTIAMTAATLADISDGRFVLGLGASTRTLVEGFHGVKFRRPAKQLRAVTQSVRQILEGARAPLPPDIDARPLRLGQTPQPDVPIFIGAMGDQAVKVAAELADGWFPVYVPRDRYATWVPELQKMRKRAGVMKTDLTVLACPGVVVSDSEPAARQMAANNLAWYLCAMGDVYAKFVSSQGYGDEVKAVLAANPKPSPANGIIPDEAQVLLDQLTVYGPPDKVREELRQWDAAVDIPVLGIAPGIAWEDIEAILRTGAPAD